MKLFLPRTAVWAGLALLLAGCAAPPPPAAAPLPEPEPEPEEVAVEPEPPPQVPVAERIREPFAVQSDGRPAPREPRGDLVVLDRPAQRTAPAAPAARAGEPEPEPEPRGANGGEPASGAAPATGEAERQPAAPAAAGPESAGVRRHVVRSGETFYGIARRYEVTPMALAAANPGLDINRLQAGQALRVPAAEPGARPAPPAPAGAAQPTPAAGQVPRTHRVVAGETLWSIARRYGVTPEQLRTANRMSDETVRVGQSLVIPGQ